MKQSRYLRPVVLAGLLSWFTGLQGQELLPLEQAKQMALERNNQLKITQQQVLAAKAAKLQADAAAKPHLDGSVTGFYVGKPLNQLLPEYGVSPSLTASQAIYAGGKIKLGQQSAAKNIEVQEEQHALTATEVVFQTEQAYWNIVSMQEKVKLAQQYKKQLQALHTDLNNQFQAGLTYKNDLLRVAVQLNEAELNIIRAEDGVTLSKLALAQLTGRNGQTGFLITDTIAGLFPPVNRDTGYAQLYQNRPEIRMMEKRIEAGQLQEKLLKADFLPSIGISAGGFGALGKEGINPTDPGKNGMASYYGMVSLSIPLLDWGGRKQKIKQQQFAIAAQQYQLQETKELLTLELQQAYIALNQAAKKVSFSEASLQQANENLKLSNDRFEAGTIVGKDVLEAQSIWQQAVTDMIEAKVSYKISEATLRKVQGVNR
ncbi:TolC family protein [Filimonas effusa]|uniref:TolC family protein n=1 Tax=Filimonas effusa TaxID=2508721 RepID=A0A4Q1DA80_9BACT|nr:TolC family protein [Filimonas effusa]RXK86277.1 TolC family protein [Filimonas effusa]